MNPLVPKRWGTTPVRQWTLQAIAYSSRNIRAIAKVVAITIVIVELGAIWTEVHKMRNEQVKNAMYALPEDRRRELKGSKAGKRMESTSYVDGSVTVDGTVSLEDQPIEVEIDQ